MARSDASNATARCDLQPQHSFAHPPLQLHCQDQDAIEYIEPAFHLEPVVNRATSSSSLAQSTQPDQPNNSCSSSVTAAGPNPASVAAPACKRDSSIFGFIFGNQRHKRRSSSVMGWDSDDDEELEKAISRAASNSIPINEKSPWLQKENKKQKQVRVCLCLAVVLCFLVLGTILAFAFKDEIFSHSKKYRGIERKTNSDEPAGKASQRFQSIETTFHVNSTITPDPNFRKIFYGIDYTPHGSQEPDCRVNLGQVIEDIKMLSQLTNRIRLYGMACQQSEAVLKAIEYLGLPDMQVILTLWVDHNSASWKEQSRIFWGLIDNDLQVDTSFIGNADGQDDTLAADTVTISQVASRIIGISIGNEVLFRNEDQNKKKEHVPLSVLEGYIQEIRAGLAERATKAITSSSPEMASLGQQLTEIPVFSSDLGRNAGQIVDQVDVIMSNIHPFFAYASAAEAADWAFQNFKNETASAAAGKPAVISEIGWPSGPSSAKLGPAVPSVENLQTFVNTWVCQANKKKVPYYFFEAFDEPWKNSINARESQWGIMTVNRKLKVSLPRC
ncbi:hypothetical protein EDD11_006208 [Mortierella claussenii]|nr:hypothetical protein EDD11_006208 [Mortierella claussenii]